MRDGARFDQCVEEGREEAPMQFQGGVGRLWPSLTLTLGDQGFDAQPLVLGVGHEVLRCPTQQIPHLVDVRVVDPSNGGVAAHALKDGKRPTIRIDRGGAKVLPLFVFEEVVDLFREEPRRGGQGQRFWIASSGSAKPPELFMMVVSRLDQVLKVKRAGSVLNDHVSEFDFADANASNE